MAPGDTSFRYKVVTCPGSRPFCARTAVGDRCSPPPGTFYDSAGPFTWDYAAPGLDFDSGWLFEDLNGAALPVNWDLSNLAANASLGGLLLHHHNAAGQRAEVFLVDQDGADLRLEQSLAGSQSVGQNVTFTLTVTNDGPAIATGVVVADPLPAGLTYVSDSGAGAYNPVTGLWSAGVLGVAASAALDIVATLEVADPVCNPAQITGGTPLDPDPSDNQAQTCVAAPHHADLAVDVAAGVTGALSGSAVTFTATVSHTGDPLDGVAETAYGVAVALEFPDFPALPISSFTASAGAFDSGAGLWSLASLAPGTSAILEVTVEAPSTDGVLTAEAAVTSSVADPDTGDNADSASVGVGYGFHSLVPCRILDTRNPAGPYGGPALAALASRTFTAAGVCGIPATAKALSLNITVTAPQSTGTVNLFETGITPPATSTASFGPGQTRACNAVTALDSAGRFTARNNSSGTTQLIVDVNGYFE
jgi:uncharacterized repeat protein (TIGR01451 family)